MSEFVAYGPWFTVNTCPKCKEPVSHTEIYEKRCCTGCGESDAIMLQFEVTTLRKAYIKKSWIPFLSKWVYEVKDRKPRFGYGGTNVGAFTRTAASLSLTTVAAAVAIM